MEVYIAGRADGKEDAIIELAKKLDARGHKIAFKWWEGERPKKPYIDHPENSVKAAVMTDAAIRSEIFVLIAGTDLMGSMVELGMAIASEKKEVIIVYENGRQSLFFIHPKISLVGGFECIYKRPWY